MQAFSGQVTFNTLNVEIGLSKYYFAAYIELPLCFVSVRVQ